MYNIKNITDGTETISDSVVLIALHSNGSYVQADKKHPAQGFCAMIPATRYDPIYPEGGDGMPDEDAEPIGTNQVDYLQSTAYVFEGQTMKGGEPVGSYVEAPAVPVITELESDLAEAYELLYG